VRDFGNILGVRRAKREHERGENEGFAEHGGGWRAVLRAIE
jgi:hypothetical protein|tara:strand:+ start:4036 stop:4158 length:123 start_codon:yes stop_codon:yes gene_type:complete